MPSFTKSPTAEAPRRHLFTLVTLTVPSPHGDLTILIKHQCMPPLCSQRSSGFPAHSKSAHPLLPREIFRYLLSHSKPLKAAHHTPKTPRTSCHGGPDPPPTFILLHSEPHLPLMPQSLSETSCFSSHLPLHLDKASDPFETILRDFMYLIHMIISYIIQGHRASS